MGRDCDRCFALCCVAPALARSADVAVDKPAGRPCPNLESGFLGGAALVGADLSGADLRLVKLTSSDLRGVDLAGADLRGAILVTPSQLESARGDATTLLPEARARPARWLTRAAR